MRVIVFIMNALLAIVALPEWLLFTCGRWRVKEMQLRLLRRLIQQNSNTQWGRKYHFDRIDAYQGFCKLPTSEYKDYQSFIEAICRGEQQVLSTSRVTTLLPTSGTTEASKLIPFTAALQKEYRRALNTWLVNLYLRAPSIFFGSHYWSMSPVSKHPDHVNSGIPIGFADDSGYFTPLQRKLLPVCFSVPPTLQSVEDASAHEYLTLLFLLRDQNLAFLSIWSPTFLIAKLEHAAEHKEQLVSDIKNGTISIDFTKIGASENRFSALLRPDPKRAETLSAIDFTKRTMWQHVWPGLKLISCWADGSSAEFRIELGRIFPQAVIEEKGLVATEAVITIPWWRKNMKPVAYRSHFFEFREIENGSIKPLWEIEPGIRYAVLVTTGSGLFRYQLHDIVEVTGFLGKIPTLRFISRENSVVDLVGEKIAEETVQSFLDSRLQAQNGFAFALVAPIHENSSIAYTLFVEPPQRRINDFDTLLTEFDIALRTNYHYHHARELGQIKAPRLFIIKPGTGLSSYLKHEETAGKRLGDIKIRVLDGGLDWSRIFKGSFFAQEVSS